MDIESRVRERIESLLVNNARGQAELRNLDSADGPLGTNDIEEERDLYHRIINSYRSALAEVNSLLETHIDFLSGFYHIVRTIQDQRDFLQICSGVVRCTLEQFGAEYCGLVFHQDSRQPGKGLCLEALAETQKFLRIHSSGKLLGSEEIETTILKLALEAREPVVIEDLYADLRFQSIDFPGVMRSLVCVPVETAGELVGFMLLTHSRPRFFGNSHIRVLQLIGSLVGYTRYLTRDTPAVPAVAMPEPASRLDDAADAVSVVLLECAMPDPLGRPVSLSRDLVRSLRAALRRTLGSGEAVLYHDEQDLLVLLPGVSSKDLPSRVSIIRDAFYDWRNSGQGSTREAQLSVGFSTCEGGADLSRCLEIASHLMHPDEDDGQAPVASAV
jgi:GAF domain